MYWVQSQPGLYKVPVLLLLFVCLSVFKENSQTSEGVIVSNAFNPIAWEAEAGWEFESSLVTPTHEILWDYQKAAEEKHG